MAVNYDRWLEAQKCALGSVLISPQLAPRILSQMTDSDFSDSCLLVFQAIRNLFSRGIPIDPITVRDALGDAYAKDLMDYMEALPTANNYQHYVDITKKRARAEHLKGIGTKMAFCDSPEEMQELLEQAIAVNAQNHSLRAVSIFDAVVNFAHRMTSDPPKYLSWPIKGMEKKLHTEKGDLVILGARPSVGKTAFALQAAWEMAKTQNVGFFSLETGVKKLTDRQIANVCDISLNDIKYCRLPSNRGDILVEFAEGEAKSRRLDLIPCSGVAVSELCAYAIAKQYDVVFIDYLQLLTAPGKTAYERATEVSLTLHKFAQSSGITVVALSQLSRAGAGSAPDMTSLRESGQIEQDADAILMLYLESEETPNGPRILRCVKNKDGERFRVKLNFDGKYQRFTKYGEDFQAVPNEETPFETIGGIV